MMLFGVGRVGCRQLASCHRAATAQSQSRSASDTTSASAKAASPGRLAAKWLAKDKLPAVIQGVHLGMRAGGNRLHALSDIQRVYGRHTRGVKVRPASLIPFAVAQDYLRGLGIPAGYQEMDVVVDKQSRGRGDGPLVPRVPVVALLGHVDHGKTTLLDAWAKSTSADREPGSITQSIRAYNIHTPHGSATVIDTPGHKLFRNMRSAGAFTCDVVVLVVDVLEGVSRQTRESIELSQEQDRPVVVALNKVDLVPPDKLRDRLKKVKAALLKVGVHIAVRTPATACTDLPSGVCAAVPIAALSSLQTDLLLREAIHAAGPQHCSEKGKPTAVIVDARYHADRGDDLSQVHGDAPEDFSNEVARPDDYAASFAPHETRAAFAGQVKLGGWSLSCICRTGTFTPGTPATWIAGRSSWGTTAEILDEWGKPVPSARPGDAFQIVGMQCSTPPEMGSHLIAVPTTQVAATVLDHRAAVLQYLKDGGGPALLTPARSPDAYYWLQAAVEQQAEEAEVADAEMDHRDLKEHGMLCREWEESLTCSRKACRFAHPADMHVEPPLRLQVLLCADSQGSLKVLETLMEKLSDRVVQIKVIHSVVGLPKVEDMGLATSVEAYGAPCVFFRLKLPRHLMPVVVTQKVDVYEFHVFTEVAHRINMLCMERRPEWEALQVRRWDRYGVHESRRKMPKQRMKRLKDLLTEDDVSLSLADLGSGDA